MGLWLRLLGVGVAASVISSACGGSDFSSVDAPQGAGGSAGSASKAGAGGVTGGTDFGASGDTSAAGTLGQAGTPSGTGGAGATGGTAGGGTVLCSDAKDCNDDNPCTLDTCPASGVCDNAPKCGGDAPVCCNGVCSQCCGMADCDDGLDCTDNSCFAGVCNFLPSERCDSGFYCSTDVANAPSGCVPVQSCDTDQDCDDPDPCTADTCVDHKCKHPLCPDGGSCCTGLGCGECCGNSQCPQTDPCTPSSCTSELKCAGSALCAEGDGSVCCKSPDGKSASCGECCVATDCPDDGVDCTDEKCKAGDGGFLTCTHEQNPDNCPMGQECDPVNDCSAKECDANNACPAPPTCKKVACDAGTCKLSNVDCSHGQKCCGSPNVPEGQCQGCCENKDCKEPGLNRCCLQTGTCAECCDDSECARSMTTGGPTPQAVVGGVSGGTMPCPGPPMCKVGKCVDNTTVCTGEQKCCPGLGCVSAQQAGCLQTF